MTRKEFVALIAAVVSGGSYVYGGYQDLDDVARSQARELDRTKRGAMLQQVQRLMHERVMFGPIWRYTFLNGTGPGVADARFTAIAGFPYTAP